MTLLAVWWQYLDPSARTKMFDKGMSKSNCAMVWAARGGHIGICAMLMEIPVKCTRKHYETLDASFRSGHMGAATIMQQRCLNLLQEGYLKDELFAALEGNDVSKAKKILDEASLAALPL